MKTTTLLLCLMSLIMLTGMVGCRKKIDKPVPEIGVLKTPAEMEPVLINLKADVDTSPDIQQEMDQIIEQYNASTGKVVQGDRLEVLYGLISSPVGDISMARRSLEIFIQLDSKAVIREALLFKHPDMVIMASQAITQNAKKGKYDNESLSYLLAVLRHNNFIQPGSESATIHVIMKEKLVEAIQQTASIDVKKIDADNPEEIEKFLQSVSRN